MALMRTRNAGTLNFKQCCEIVQLPTVNSSLFLFFMEWCVILTQSGFQLQCSLFEFQYFLFYSAFQLPLFAFQLRFFCIPKSTSHIPISTSYVAGENFTVRVPRVADCAPVVENFQTDGVPKISILFILPCCILYIVILSITLMHTLEH